MPCFIAVGSTAVIEHVSSKLEVTDSRSCQQDRTMVDTWQGMLAWVQFCALVSLQLSEQTRASGCLECKQRSSDWAAAICGDFAVAEQSLFQSKGTSVTATISS